MGGPGWGQGLGVVFPDKVSTQWEDRVDLAKLPCSNAEGVSPCRAMQHHRCLSVTSGGEQQNPLVQRR